LENNSSAIRKSKGISMNNPTETNETQADDWRQPVVVTTAEVTVPKADPKPPAPTPIQWSVRVD
jgi:hypothetical protein